MADENIIKPGFAKQDEGIPATPLDIYLYKSRALGDLEGLEDIARSNLGVPSLEITDELKRRLDEDVPKSISNAIAGLGIGDLSQQIANLKESDEKSIKQDNPHFEHIPSTNQSPSEDNHLINREYLNQRLKTIVNNETEALNNINDQLTNFAKTSEINRLDNSLTEISKNFDQYVKTNGSTPFTRPQKGIDPEASYHLATKRYVDKVLKQHEGAIDPHYYNTILDKRLAWYVRKGEVYKKEETYDRAELDDLTQKLVDRAIGNRFAEHDNDINEKFENIRLQHYIKQDGKVPFKAPQSGVAGKEDNNLTTLRQVRELIEKVNSDLNTKIDNKECKWITSGPVESTVGHVEDNTEVPETMTFQEIMDAIFYGKGITIDAPELSKIGKPVEVTVCVKGSQMEIDRGELYQNGVLIRVFDKEDFESSRCINVTSNPIEEDTEFTFKVEYTNGSSHEVTTITKISMPIFIGLIHKWKVGDTLTYQQLFDLWESDKQNNQFYDKDVNITQIVHKFNFVDDLEDKDLKQIILVLPDNYPDLYQMCVPSQQFGIEAFDDVRKMPFQIPGADATLYKMFIYKQPLSQLHQKTTFNFETKE